MVKTCSSSQAFIKGVFLHLFLVTFLLSLALVKCEIEGEVVEDPSPSSKSLQTESDSQVEEKDDEYSDDEYFVQETDKEITKTIPILVPSIAEVPYKSDDKETDVEQQISISNLEEDNEETHSDTTSASREEGEYDDVDDRALPIGIEKQDDNTDDNDDDDIGSFLLRGRGDDDRIPASTEKGPTSVSILPEIDTDESGYNDDEQESDTPQRVQPQQMFKPRWRPPQSRVINSARQRPPLVIKSSRQRQPTRPQPIPLHLQLAPKQKTIRIPFKVAVPAIVPMPGQPPLPPLAPLPITAVVSPIKNGHTNQLNDNRDVEIRFLLKQPGDLEKKLPVPPKEGIQIKKRIEIEEKVSEPVVQPFARDQSTFENPDESLPSLSQLEDLTVNQNIIIKKKPSDREIRDLLEDLANGILQDAEDQYVRLSQSLNPNSFPSSANTEWNEIEDDNLDALFSPPMTSSSASLSQYLVEEEANEDEEDEYGDRSRRRSRKSRSSRADAEC